MQTHTDITYYKLEDITINEKPLFSLLLCQIGQLAKTMMMMTTKRKKQFKSHTTHFGKTNLVCATMRRCITLIKMITLDNQSIMLEAIFKK